MDNTKRFRAAVVACALTALLTQSGCTILAVGAAGTVAAVSANDRRTVGTQLDDTTTQGKIAFQLSQVDALKEFTTDKPTGRMFFKTAITELFF